MTEPIIVEEQQPPTTSSSRWIKIGIFFSTCAMIILIGAFGYSYFELSNVNLALAQQVTTLQDKAETNNKTLTTLQESIENLQQSAQKSQQLASEQEKLAANWQAMQKGGLEKWQVAEAQYLVKLANDHLQFTYQTALALALLQRAEQILQPLQDANLVDIRKAIATDITHLQSASQINMTALYTRLNVLNKALDQLSLPPTPLQADKEEIISQDLPWWKAGLAYSWQALKKIVIVRNTANNALPLVLPEEKIFLYQNLHAQIEAAMWGVLHRDADVYQASLMRTQAWIQQYFDQNAMITKTLLQTLGELQKINIQPPSIDLSTSLQLFNVYFSKVNATS
ncbi:MAG: uroporphyrinogen-III C-methyltransferase [Gammaproteobacteria bacterium]|nr:uroporphyrinogen-III C-methyltransferase [Gammaproteobacteria bacterium]